MRTEPSFIFLANTLDPGGTRPYEVRPALTIPLWTLTVVPPMFMEPSEVSSPETSSFPPPSPHETRARHGTERMTAARAFAQAAISFRTAGRDAG